MKRNERRLAVENQIKGHSIYHFKKIALTIGAKNKDVNDGIRRLKETESGKKSYEKYGRYIFTEEDMFSILKTIPICDIIIKKQRYTRWYEIEDRFSEVNLRKRQEEKIARKFDFREEDNF